MRDPGRVRPLWPMAICFATTVTLAACSSILYGKKSSQSPRKSAIQIDLSDYTSQEYVEEYLKTHQLPRVVELAESRWANSDSSDQALRDSLISDSKTDSSASDQTDSTRLTLAHDYPNPF